MRLPLTDLQLYEVPFLCKPYYNSPGTLTDSDVKNSMVRKKERKKERMNEWMKEKPPFEPFLRTRKKFLQCAWTFTNQQGKNFSTKITTVKLNHTHTYTHTWWVEKKEREM